MQSYQTLAKRKTQNKSVTQLRKIMIDTNRYKVDVSKLKCLCIFAVKFVSEKVEENYEQRLEILQKITPELNQFIDSPIIKDGYIYSLKPPKCTDKTIKIGDYIVIVREIYRFDAEKQPQMLIFFLSNVMRKIMDKLGYIQVGKSKKFIDMSKKAEVENVLIYSGFKVKFELLDNGYFLTVDTTKKIVRNQSVLEYINQLYKANQGREREQKRELVRKNLLNKIVMTNYGKTRYLKIQDVLFVDLTQVIVQSCKMFLHQYYLFRYNYEIKSLKQPLLFSKIKNSRYKTYLIPELCLMTGIPDEFQETSNKLVTEMARISCEDRKQKIDEFVKVIKDKQGGLIFPLLGVGINSESEKVQSKVLPLPKIVFGSGKTVHRGRQAAFHVQDMTPYKLKQGIKIAIITYDGVDSSSIIEYFHETFKNLKIKVGVTTIRIENSSYNRGVQNLSSFIELAKVKQNCNICLIIIPNKMKKMYQAIKQQTLLKKQINCQVVLETTLKKKNVLTIALKILVQLLAKAGSTFWTVIPQIQKPQVMFVAYYSTELCKIKSNSFTIGICASCNQSQTQFFSKTKAYLKEYDELQSMKELLFEALSAYKKKNGCLPEDIVILENRKSVRTLKTTKSFFLEPSISLMKDFYGEKRPKITYILVTTCLNQRYFRHSEGKVLNPPIGTLINSHVTTCKEQFYIFSHNINLSNGSVIPLSYRIAFTDSDLSPLTIQSMLFSQSFNYMNYSGSVKEPAVLKNAIRCTRFGAQVLCNLEVPQKLNLYPYYL